MSTPDLKLTPTSYAILGMVGLQPCTTYALSKAMQRSFDYFWPRARSLVYIEVKRLALLGLLSAHKDPVGQRPRTIYAITPAGRAELAAWLRTPPRTFALELEGLLRLYLAPFGTREDLLQTLTTMHEDAETMLRIAAVFQRSYIEGTSLAMEHVHVRALLNDFLANYAEFVRQWAERSIATIGDWADLSLDGKAAQALQTLAGLPSLDDSVSPRRAQHRPARLVSE